MGVEPYCGGGDTAFSLAGERMNLGKETAFEDVLPFVRFSPGLRGCTRVRSNNGLEIQNSRKSDKQELPCVGDAQKPFEVLAVLSSLLPSAYACMLCLSYIAASSEKGHTL